MVLRYVMREILAGGARRSKFLEISRRGRATGDRLQRATVDRGEVCLSGGTAALADAPSQLRGRLMDDALEELGLVGRGLSRE